MKPANEVAQDYVRVHGVTGSHGAWIGNPDAMIDDIGTLVTQARREGAEDMRERAICEVSGNQPQTISCIHALPLPGDE